MYSTDHYPNEGFLPSNLYSQVTINIHFIIIKWLTYKKMVSSGFHSINCLLLITIPKINKIVKSKAFLSSTLTVLVLVLMIQPDLLYGWDTNLHPRKKKKCMIWEEMYWKIWGGKHLFDNQWDLKSEYKRMDKTVQPISHDMKASWLRWTG